MSSSVGSEIISSVWKGTIKLKIALDRELTEVANGEGGDGVTIQEPRLSEENDIPIFYTTSNRNTYFHFLLPQILFFFSDHIKDKESLSRNDWWVEFENVPLKWNWPLGLLHDIYRSYNPSNKNANAEPWELVLKFNKNKYPISDIIPIAEEPNNNEHFSLIPLVEDPSSIKFLETYWVNQMKESCFVLNGSSKSIMNLSKESSSNLWRSVAFKNADTFEGIFRSILPKHVGLINHVPVRFYLPISNLVLQPVIAPINPETKSKTTLGEVLQKNTEDLFPASLMYTVALPVCHGVLVPMNTPIIDLFFLMKYMDGFLHINIIMAEKMVMT
ncbi:hypothetical protein BVG19_g319 [[Candida] boidinii]|nr:hypothetical protein BVG19_g319 [[Candida] boidinii]